jgi:hypothetical protein
VVICLPGGYTRALRPDHYPQGDPPDPVGGDSPRCWWAHSLIARASEPVQSPPGECARACQVRGSALAWRCIEDTPKAGDGGTGSAGSAVKPRAISRSSRGR